MTASTTLLLRLAAPLQAWGDHRAVIETRHTSPMPTKSGVIGLLGAALGRERDEPLGTLAELTIGVRADVPGTLLRDYHTVSDHRGVPLLSSKVNAKGHQVKTSPARYTKTGERFYLQDAAFLVAVHGPASVMADVTAAAKAPVAILALGRRSCPPTFPLVLGTTSDPIADVLTSHDWLASPHARTVWQRQHRGASPATVEVSAVLDDPDGETVLQDQPLSYAFGGPRHTSRRVRHVLIPLPTGFDPGPETTSSEGHDPLALLGW